MLLNKKANRLIYWLNEWHRSQGVESKLCWAKKQKSTKNVDKLLPHPAIQYGSHEAQKAVEIN